MRTPKAPAGFVPVDSEEAKNIGGNVTVNFVCVGDGDRWLYGRASLHSVRLYHEQCRTEHYHVQIPPPVEWEEVWGWERTKLGTTIITKHGEQKQIVAYDLWTDHQLDTIVSALNEMEGRDG